DASTRAPGHRRRSALSLPMHSAHSEIPAPRPGPSSNDGPSRVRVDRALRRRRGAYWTFAVSELATFKVKVQVFVLFPPLLHTPDQITSRPLVALRVIRVPTV